MSGGCSLVDMAAFAGIAGGLRYEIVHGDCLTGLKKLGDGEIGVVVTSPPYNQGMNYGAHCDDRRERGDYLAWCEVWLGEIFRTLEREGALFLNLGASHADPLLPYVVVLWRSGWDSTCRTRFIG